MNSCKLIYYIVFLDGKQKILMRLKENENNFSIAKSAIFSSVLTFVILGFCIISIGIGHGSSLPFKLAFPFPYGLFEVLNKENEVLGNSIIPLIIAGFLQNFFYLFLAQKLRVHISNFMSYSIVILFHLIIFVFVNGIFE